MFLLGFRVTFGCSIEAGKSQPACYCPYSRVRPVWAFKILKRESGAGTPKGASRWEARPPGTLYRVPVGLKGRREFFPWARKGRGEGNVHASARIKTPFQSAAHFITKIVPPTGQSVEQFSYTNRVVFCTVFVMVVASKNQFGVLVGHAGKVCFPSHVAPITFRKQYPISTTKTCSRSRSYI